LSSHTKDFQKLVFILCLWAKHLTPLLVSEWLDR